MNAAVEPWAAGTLVSNSWFSRRFVPGRSSWLNCRILAARSAGRTPKLTGSPTSKRNAAAGESVLNAGLGGALPAAPGL